LIPIPNQINWKWIFFNLTPIPNQMNWKLINFNLTPIPNQINFNWKWINFPNQVEFLYSDGAYYKGKLKDNTAQGYG